MGASRPGARLLARGQQLFATKLGRGRVTRVVQQFARFGLAFNRGHRFLDLQQLFAGGSHLAEIVATAKHRRERDAGQLREAAPLCRKALGQFAAVRGWFAIGADQSEGWGWGETGRVGWVLKNRRFSEKGKSPRFGAKNSPRRCHRLHPPKTHQTPASTVQPRGNAFVRRRKAAEREEAGG